MKKWKRILPGLLLAGLFITSSQPVLADELQTGGTETETQVLQAEQAEELIVWDDEPEETEQIQAEPEAVLFGEEPEPDPVPGLETAEEPDQPLFLQEETEAPAAPMAVQQKAKTPTTTNPAPVAAAVGSYFTKAKAPTVEKDKNGLKISWKKSKNADGYRVYRKLSKYKKWKKLQDVRSRRYLYDTKAKVGTSYDYLVLPYKIVDGKKRFAKYDAESAASGIRLEEPAIKKIVSKNSGLRLTWEEASGATSYWVYRKTSTKGEWKLLAKTTKTSWSDTKVKAGKLYYYTVRAKNGAFKSTRGTHNANGLYLVAPTMRKAVYSDQGIKARWQALAGAAGYCVYRATGNGTYRLLGRTTRTWFLDEAAEPGTDYRYTVRAYSAKALKCNSEAAREVKANLPAIYSKFVQDANNVVVMLNAGHDQVHTGCRNGNFKEYEMTLKIAKACKAELETYQNVTVLMMRETASCPFVYTDEGSDLIKRIRSAKTRGADVYVSIHINAGTGGNSMRGIWVLPQMQTKTWRPWLGKVSDGIGESMRAELVKLGFQPGITYHRENTHWPRETYPDGTVADYYSELYTGMMENLPTVIMEHGFIDNDDLKLLNTNAKLKAVGIADATGIANYYGLKKK